jgi:hypothetical protein
MIDREHLQGTPSRAREPNGNLELSVNCFTPADRQTPISLPCAEPSHMRNLGQEPVTGESWLTVEWKQVRGRGMVARSRMEGGADVEREIETEAGD